ncbi:hypothetical protein G3O00_26840 [Burkholderia sp. Ac-20384]|nr:hypothetical protein [Burkholderia sp. Ac-20384]
MIDTARPDYGVYLSAPLDTTSAQHFSVEAGLSAPNTQPFDHATANPGAFAPAGFHAPLPTDQPMVPIASGSQHTDDSAPLSRNAEPRNFTPIAYSGVALRPRSPSPVASSSRNTLPLAGSSAAQSQATHASDATASGPMSQQVKSALNIFFRDYPRAGFETLSLEKRKEIVDNFTPSRTSHKVRPTYLPNLRHQIRTALRKEGLLPPSTIPRSNAERPADEQAALEKITLENRKVILGGFMSDLRKQGSSITLFEHMTPEQRQIHIDNYLLGKGTTLKKGLPNVLKELGLSGTGQ